MTKKELLNAKKSKRLHPLMSARLTLEIFTTAKTFAKLAREYGLAISTVSERAKRLGITNKQRRAYFSDSHTPKKAKFELYPETSHVRKRGAHRIFQIKKQNNENKNDNTSRSENVPALF